VFGLITPKVNAYVDTAFDCALLGMSVAAYNADPSLLNGAAIAIDGIAILCPFFPAVGGCTLRAINSSLKARTAMKHGIRTYTSLKRVLRGTGLQAHHIMPKLFKGLFGIKNGDDMFSIALDKRTHEAISARIASTYPTWKVKLGFYSDTEIKNGIKYIYQQMYFETEDYIFKYMADFIENGQYVPN